MNGSKYTEHIHNIIPFRHTKNKMMITETGKVGKKTRREEVDRCGLSSLYIGGSPIVLAHSRVSINSYALCISKTSKKELGMTLLPKYISDLGCKYI